MAYIGEKDANIFANILRLQLGVDVEDVIHKCNFRKIKCQSIECDLQDYQAIYLGRIYVYNIGGARYSDDFSAIVEESADGVSWSPVAGANGTYIPTLSDAYYRITINCGRASRILTINAGEHYDYVFPVLYKINNGVWNNIRTNIDVNMNDTIEFTCMSPLFGVEYVLTTTGVIGANNTSTITAGDIIGNTDTLTTTVKDANGNNIDFVTTLTFT
jgi:hypothetical protein